MSYTYTTPMQGVLGLQPRELVIRSRNSGSVAITQYALVQLDLAQSSTEPGNGSSTYPTASNSKWANVKLGPVSNSVTSAGWWGVAQEAIAVGAEGAVMLNGITTIQANASATFTIGNTVGLPIAANAVTAGKLINGVNVATPIGVVLTTSTGTTPQIYLEGGFRPGLIA